MATEQDPMDRSLALLWGRTSTPSRGPRPKMSVPGIVEAAVRLADAEGLDALSMQKLAAELGYTTMSLYRYVPGKESLVDLMLDHAVGQPPEDIALAPDWRTGVERWARAIWAVDHRHPWLLRVQVDRPPVGPNQLAWMEAGLRVLAGSGLAGYERLSVLTFVYAAVQGLARVSVDQRPRAERDGPVANAYGKVLGRYVDAERYPELVGILSGGVFDVPPETPDADDVLPDLEFGLAHLLSGVESYVQARQASQ
ncbi:AcrR family transcriptional regulator [Crossiella equi]|uniref:AcrR family transcriptional regulator n=1 Tax=Crossiella equi TaxID=130796 RepID=A0ABS5AAZ0_9PSEU|nr:TetR/AcrR family transcriptional regulator [Crossiella equi]MBP2473753.1 AcrR family transcriptional regulator [Crossiella equi]